MNSKKCYKIYLIGVGGQGTVKTATIIGEAISPLIEKNAADLVLAFEPSELLRILNRIGKDTMVIASRFIIIPFTVSLGISEYQDKVEMFDKFKQKIKNLYLIDAEKLAKKAGHIITTNIVILGAALAISQFPVKKEAIIESIRKNVLPHTVDINVEALDLGYKQFISTHTVKN
jgi:indolepyruvate ferredoxin oxidoreductase, beta subunit